MSLDAATVIAKLLVVLISITIHEASHAWAADLLGDSTARRAGRLTLNPIPHIDPVGTLLLPVLLALAGGPVFGWAKPVPINPMAFKQHRLGMMLSALAGPASNLMVAAACGLALQLVAVATGGQPPISVVTTLALFVQLNVILAVFNLIPIPPLDGSRVVPVFLSHEAARAWDGIERYGILIVLVLIAVVPQITGVSPLAWYFDHVGAPVVRFLDGWLFAALGL